MDFGVLSSVIGLASMAGNAIQTSAENKAAKKQAQAQTAYLQEQQKNTEQEKQNLLKTQLAKQRASFASSGLNPDEGSASAVIGNIQDRADDDLEEIRSSYRYKLNNINNSLANKRSKNLLSTTNSILKKTSGLLT